MQEGSGSLLQKENDEGTSAERDLVRRARSGDREAFADIVRRHQRRVYGVALRMTRRHEVADDVVQETFLRAFKSLHAFDEGRPLGPWLGKIAVNLSINHLKGPTRREQALYTEDTPEGPVKLGDREEGGPVETDPHRSLESERFAEALAAAVARLAPEHRSVFVLKVVEGMRYEDIARTLEISPGTVMSRLSRARAKLKHLLADHL